jgi:hypothetical protein
MRIQAPLSAITPTVDADVLTVLARTDAAFTTGDLHRLIPKRSAEGIRKTLARLVAEGIVTTENAGRTRLYRLNQQHLAASAVIMLADLEAEFLSRLRTEISGWTEQPVFAALFGSSSRGDMQSHSDVDIFLVRDDHSDPDVFQAQADRLAMAVSAWTGNDARPLIYQASEVGPKDPVLGSIGREGKTLAGDPVWFRRAIRRVDT